MDTTVKVWNLHSGELEQTFSGHSSSVNAVAVTPDGERVISGSEDKTLKVWNLPRGEVIASFSGDGSITCCAISPDSQTLIAGDSSGRLHFLRLVGLEPNP
jgi:WD40 repeat protein